MNRQQVALVQDSFAAVLPIADTAAALFFDRLFTLDPALRSLFTGDMAKQGRKLMQMLRLAVANLERPDTLIPALQALGAHHAGYGVAEHHYDTVGEALLWTLAQGLGDAFTDEVQAAWVACYRLVAETMKEAARVATPVPALPV